MGFRCPYMNGTSYIFTMFCFLLMDMEKMRGRVGRRTKMCLKRTLMAFAANDDVAVVSAENRCPRSCNYWRSGMAALELEQQAIC
jgi:hypothetical protein